jgi:DNA repair protein RadC
MTTAIETYKEYGIDESDYRKVQLYSYTDLVIKDAATAAHIIRSLYSPGQIELVEYAGFLAMDEDAYLFGYAFMSKGGIVQTTFDPQVIYKNLSISGAKKVIFFHNHPSGNLQPSPADITVTYASSAVLSSMGIEYLDHVIVTPLGYYSFAEDKTKEGFRLTQYAATGVKLKEATVEANVPELRLYVKKSNVTEAFYKSTKKLNSHTATANFIEKLLDRNGAKSNTAIGFVAVNNAQYPDFASMSALDEASVNPSDDAFFKEYSRTMMSACSRYMVVFINRPVEGGVALDSNWTNFFVKLGALGSIVGLNVLDIVVRDSNTGQTNSIIEDVQERLNEMMAAGMSGGDDAQIEAVFKFIKI